VQLTSTLVFIDFLGLSCYNASKTFNK